MPVSQVSRPFLRKRTKKLLSAGSAPFLSKFGWQKFFVSRFQQKGLAFLLLLAASPAYADTMPQLDFKNPLVLSQVVWGALIFAGFYGLASRWGLPKVAAILEMRAATIAGDLERARASKQAADAAVTELTAARRKAYAESQAAIAAAGLTAKTQAAARAAEQDARLDAKLAESETQIAQARGQAMGALRQVAGETAVAIVARLTDGHADPHRVEAAVVELLAERGLAA